MRKQLGYLPGTEPHYTVRQKIETWFYYYKWALLIGIIVIIMLIPVVKNLLGIGVVEPDYQIACVTPAGLSKATAAELTAAVEALGRDLNGDGEVCVKLVQYNTGAGDAETKLYYSYAASVTLMADLQVAESHFFLMDDPEQFQLGYQVLADENGRLPEDADYRAEGRFLPMSALKLSLSDGAKKELEPLFFGQRGYYDESKVPDLAAFRELWDALTGQ